MGDSIKGFCTRYAITTGILPVTVEPRFRPNSKNLYYYDVVGGMGIGSGVIELFKEDFFESREAAEADALQRAREEVVRLKKRLKHMEERAKTPKWEEG